MKLIDVDNLGLTDFEIAMCDGDYKEALKLLLSKIENAPIVDAIPAKHGYWIFNPKDVIEMMFTLPKCSECGAESVDGGNYCPNCGARMDEE